MNINELSPEQVSLLPFEPKGNIPIRWLPEYLNIWTIDDKHRLSSHVCPPDGDYVVIEENIPVTTQTLFELLREYRLLSGILQFYDYYHDENFRKFVDYKAENWLKLLQSISVFWIFSNYSNRYIQSEEYIEAKDRIIEDIYQYYKWSKKCS